MPTMLETFGKVNNCGSIDATNRKQVREYFKKYYPDHLDNLNEAYKNGWIKRGYYEGIFLSDKGVRRQCELDRTGTWVKLGDGRMGKAIVNQKGIIVEWLSHPDNIHLTKQTKEETQ